MPIRQSLISSDSRHGCEFGDRFISTRSMSNVLTNKYRTVSPKKAHKEYRNLLRNELFDSGASTMCSSPQLPSNGGDDAEEDADENLPYLTNHYEIREKYKKYYEFNKGASPTNDKDKLSKTPQTTPSSSPTVAPTPYTTRRCLTFSTTQSSKLAVVDEPGLVSTTPILYDTQQQISNYKNRFRHKTVTNRKLRNVQQFAEHKNVNQSKCKMNHGEVQNQLKPYRVIHAPDIIDDFYSSILDWNAHSNKIGVALQNEVCVFDPQNSETSSIRLGLQQHKSIVSSIKFSPFGEHMSVGTDDGTLRVYDINKNSATCKYVSLSAHTEGEEINTPHIGAMEWSSHWNNACIMIGSKTSNKMHVYDLRHHQQCALTIDSPTKCVSLKWSPDMNKFAVGGRDRCVSIFDIRFLKHRIFKLKFHSSSIRAIDWSPHNYNILASGGGALDKKICVWNLNHTHSKELHHSCVTINKPIKYIRTTSQICNLIWHPYREHQLLSTHGFDTNDINVWNLNDDRGASLLSVSTHGHDKRALYVALSKNKENILTASSDETLMFWNVFQPNRDTTNQNFTPNIR